MKISGKENIYELCLQWKENGAWVSADEKRVKLDLGTECRERGYSYYPYTVELLPGERTLVRLLLRSNAEEDVFHLIPCCIYGDNNAESVHFGEFPLLTAERFDETGKEDPFRSSYWSFRADRAAMPLSALCGREETVAVTIDPYTEQEDGGFLHNGVFSMLPNGCGVTMGYENAPISFINKRTPGPVKSEYVSSARACGRIYVAFPETEHERKNPRLAIHHIIRAEYLLRREMPKHEKSAREAAYACLKSFTELNWDSIAMEYTNRSCLPPADTVLRPWRNVVEIGWTGGGVLAYPLILSERLFGEEAERLLSKARSGEEILEQIVAAYNEKSGFFNDLTHPIEGSGSPVNGWWTAFGLTRDVHCAYNVSSALHYLLKSILFLKEERKDYPARWLKRARDVADTAVCLQRGDGAFGYTFSISEKKVVDWEGFAGCWFVPCLTYLYALTGERKYLQSAEKGLTYYWEAVRSLTCCGTPMDTWKSPDQEGNLAFLRGARLLYECTGEDKYLEALKDAANFEYLWRYGYRTRPDYKPLREGWCSCGGSVTSVSNPHIHPMGMIVDSDLYYLAAHSGDSYHRQRAEDGTNWILQTLELYPQKTGYGDYGVLSERWCPSDGLVIQRDSNGEPYSSWYSYNLWAASAAFEEVCERALEELDTAAHGV